MGLGLTSQSKLGEGLERSAAIPSEGWTWFFFASAAVPILLGPIEPRDRDWIDDYRAVASAIPRETTIGTCVDAAEDWRLHAYLQRFFRVSLDVEASSRHRFYLQLKDRPCAAPPSCRVASDALHFALLECRP